VLRDELLEDHGVHLGLLSAVVALCNALFTADRWRTSPRFSNRLVAAAAMHEVAWAGML
jgi:hypothetical protein